MICSAPRVPASAANHAQPSAKLSTAVIGCHAFAAPACGGAQCLPDPPHASLLAVGPGGHGPRQGNPPSVRAAPHRVAGRRRSSPRQFRRSDRHSRRITRRPIRRRRHAMWHQIAHDPRCALGSRLPVYHSNSPSAAPRVPKRPRPSSSRPRAGLRRFAATTPPNREAGVVARRRLPGNRSGPVESPSHSQPGPHPVRQRRTFDSRCGA